MVLNLPNLLNTVGKGRKGGLRMLCAVVKAV